MDQSSVADPKNLTPPFTPSLSAAVPEGTPPAPTPNEETPLQQLCPRCSTKLVNPESLGWCPKCGFCRSLEENGLKEAPVVSVGAPRPSKLGAVEFFELLGKTPQWARVLAAGCAAVVLFSGIATVLLPANSLARAVWSSLQLALGLVAILAAQAWAMALVAPHDDSLGAKDLVISTRLWGHIFRRLPEMRKQLWIGAWGLSTALTAVFLVGGLTYWYRYYKPQRVADKNLIAAAAALAEGKEKALEDAVKDFADSQDLTKEKKDEKEQDKDKAKQDKRPTVHCVILGYILDQDKSLSKLVLGTLHDDRVQFGGLLQQGLTPQASDELLKRLKPLQRPTPLLRGLTLDAIWVKPQIFCEVHQSGYDQDGHLIKPAFGGILDKK